MPATTPRPPSSEQVAAFDRTAWSRSIGIHGRNPRNPQFVAQAKIIAPASAKNKPAISAALRPYTSEILPNTGSPTITIRA
jgi:hypothetical protein